MMRRTLEELRGVLNPHKRLILFLSIVSHFRYRIVGNRFITRILLPHVCM